jgi:hypothetical protein
MPHDALQDDKLCHSPSRPRPVPTPNWSPRQQRASGLNRRFYAPHVRELVDYDYDAALPEEARVWLAAFTEEHYRGWRLKSEQQLLGLPALRAADADRKRTGRARKTAEPVVITQMADDLAAAGYGAATETDLVEAMDRKRAATARRERK